MIAIGLLFVRMLCDCFKSRRRLEAEILILRHQLNVLQQRMPRRVHLRWADRAVFIWLYRRYPHIIFLRNPMDGIASIDLCVVPTIAFQQLYAFLVLGHRRRQLLWFAVTQNPTADWWRAKSDSIA